MTVEADWVLLFWFDTCVVGWWMQLKSKGQRGKIKRGVVRFAVCRSQLNAGPPCYTTLRPRLPVFHQGR